MTGLLVGLCPSILLADCYLPEPPDNTYSAQLEREFSDVIANEYFAYFDNAQAYFRCVDEENAILRREVSEILQKYREFAARNPR